MDWVTRTTPLHAEMQREGKAGAGCQGAGWGGEGRQQDLMQGGLRRKERKGGSPSNCQTAVAALRTCTRGKQPLHCTACIAAGLLICQVKRNVDLQNLCTEMFQWRKGKATSSSSVYCELQAEQLLSDVGSLSKAGINLPLYLSLVAFSPCGACCQGMRR